MSETTELECRVCHVPLEEWTEDTSEPMCNHCWTEQYIASAEAECGNLQRKVEAQQIVLTDTCAALAEAQAALNEKAAEVLELQESEKRLKETLAASQEERLRDELAAARAEIHTLRQDLLVLRQAR